MKYIKPFGFLFFLFTYYSFSPVKPYVKIGLSKIYYHVQGKGHTIVVFVSGMAHDHKIWGPIQDSIALQSLTFSYDRSGLGQSEYHNEKKDLNSVAKELDHLLNSLGIDSHLILVGHSMGCQVIKKYASMHPDKVKGLVFIDPGYDQRLLKLRISDSLWYEREIALKKYQNQFNAAQEEEHKNGDRICEQADNITNLPHVPIIFFTATMVTEFPASEMEQKLKMERHLVWLKDMPQAKHILIPTSWHYIQVDEPHQVIDAIETLTKN